MCKFQLDVIVFFCGSIHIRHRIARQTVLCIFRFSTICRAYNVFSQGTCVVGRRRSLRSATGHLVRVRERVHARGVLTPIVIRHDSAEPGSFVRFVMGHVVPGTKKYAGSSGTYVTVSFGRPREQSSLTLTKKYIPRS